MPLFPQFPSGMYRGIYLYLFTLEVCTELHVGLPVRRLLFLSCSGEMDVVLKDVAQIETLTESEVTLISLVALQNVHKIKLRYFSHVIQDRENIYVLYFLIV